jgi:hypothetical protein
MPRSITQMRWALPYWLSIFCWKPRNLVLSAVLPGKTSNVRKASGVTISAITTRTQLLRLSRLWL